MVESGLPRGRPEGREGLGACLPGPAKGPRARARGPASGGFPPENTHAVREQLRDTFPA